jgi:hypothetical protein
MKKSMSTPSREETQQRAFLQQNDTWRFTSPVAQRVTPDVVEQLRLQHEDLFGPDEAGDFSVGDWEILCVKLQQYMAIKGEPNDLVNWVRDTIASDGVKTETLKKVFKHRDHKKKGCISFNHPDHSAVNFGDDGRVRELKSYEEFIAVESYLCRWVKGSNTLQDLKSELDELEEEAVEACRVHAAALKVADEACRRKLENYCVLKNSAEKASKARDCAEQEYNLAEFEYHQAVQHIRWGHWIIKVLRHELDWNPSGAAAAARPVEAAGSKPGSGLASPQVYQNLCSRQETPAPARGRRRVVTFVETGATAFPQDSDISEADAEVGQGMGLSDALVLDELKGAYPGDVGSVLDHVLPDGGTLLHWACQEGRLDWARVLVTEGLAMEDLKGKVAASHVVGVPSG